MFKASVDGGRGTEGNGRVLRGVTKVVRECERVIELQPVWFQVCEFGWHCELSGVVPCKPHFSSF